MKILTLSFRRIPKIKLIKLFAVEWSSFGKVSTTGQTQIGLGPKAYPFTIPDCCTV